MSDACRVLYTTLKDAYRENKKEWLWLGYAKVHSTLWRNPECKKNTFSHTPSSFVGLLWEVLHACIWLLLSEPPTRL